MTLYRPHEASSNDEVIEVEVNLRHLIDKILARYYIIIIIVIIKSIFHI